MADFMVLFDAGAEPGLFAVHGQIEAWLPIRFPEQEFRFALTTENGAPVRVLPIAGRTAEGGLARDAAARLVTAAIEEWLMSRVAVPRG